MNFRHRGDENIAYLVGVDADRTAGNLLYVMVQIDGAKTAIDRREQARLAHRPLWNVEGEQPTTPEGDPDADRHPRACDEVPAPGST